MLLFCSSNCSSVQIDNKKKDILVCSKGSTRRLDNTATTEEAKYSINFTRSRGKLCLSVYYNGRNGFLFVNTTKIYQLKTNDSKVKTYPLRLGNILKDFTVNNIKIRIKWTLVRLFF